MWLTSHHGKSLFAAAQKSMCSCSCIKTNTTTTCVDDSASKLSGVTEMYCADVGQDDNNNCGACGRKCGLGSLCRKGQCAPLLE
ncbi:hypothetical protein E4U43_005787 [Claviceps pusilla]|uniref:Uncharacterized protein n=1 Tax=Claviceps pusilla TaxID=123648 RepID=A0A9P7N3S1_9HYPO|nr:hypothetical protein E4U43_005787 [Claviceps pusilla]